MCDCTHTPFHGLYCNEYYKLERIKFIDLIIIVITTVMFYLTLLLMLIIFLFRKENKIKACIYFSSI